MDKQPEAARESASLPEIGPAAARFPAKNMYIDTHCHLASERFAGDMDEVIRRSLAAGVRPLATAADLASSRLSLELAERFPEVLATVGAHPNDVAHFGEEEWRELESLARSPRVAAIGETGLDYYWHDTPPETQKIWFERHIDLAMRLDKPVVVHARDSVPDVLALLAPHLASGLKAIWHCFVAKKKELGPALDFAIRHRLFLGLGGLVTFEDQKPLRAIAPAIPDELLLLETDAPYLAPRPRKSDRNEPTGVIRTAEVLAELRQTTPEEVAAITTRNALELLPGFGNS